MKYLKWLVLGTLLALAVAGSASAADPVTLTVYNPTGATQVTETFAPRLSDLNGKTICEVTIGIWEANRTFPFIRDLIQKQFPTATLVPFDKIVRLSETRDIPGLEESVQKAGCQAAIIGNAG